MQPTNLPVLVLSLLASLTLAAPTVLEPRAACTKDQLALSKGIQDNIKIQNQELASLKEVGSATGDDSKAAQANFIKVIKSGQTVRLLPLISSLRSIQVSPARPFLSSNLFHLEVLYNVILQP